MWQDHSAEMFAKLKELGINGGEYGGRNTTAPEFLLKTTCGGMRKTLRRISIRLTITTTRTGTRLGVQAGAAGHQKNPTSLEPFKRHPSLTDHEWLKNIHDRLVASARFFSAYRPFFYSLGDE